MKICFQKDAWDESAVTHAYTYRFPYTNRFVQRDTCIENGENPAMPDGFDYLSIMTREKYPLGSTITTRCSFSGDAAPLLIFADALAPDRARTAFSVTATTLRWCCIKKASTSGVSGAGRTAR